MIDFSRILCPIDLSDNSRHALQHAIATARWYGSQLSVLHVLPFVPAINVIPALAAVPAQQIRLAAADRQQFDRAARQFVHDAAPGKVPIEVIVTDAPDVRREILEQARTLDADLLVMGTHGRSGFDRVLLGSTAEKVLRKAACPVMVVPPHADHPVAAGDVAFDRILCAVDFSNSAVTALMHALSMAEEADARLTVLNVIETLPDHDGGPASALVDADALRAAAERRLGQLRALIPPSVLPYCTVDTVVSEGTAWRGILQAAADRRSDLIVMGVHGRGALDLALFGSNTHQVIRGQPVRS